MKSQRIHLIVSISLKLIFFSFEHDTTKGVHNHNLKDDEIVCNVISKDDLTLK